VTADLLVLALDGASPVASVALARGEEVLAADSEPRHAGGRELLALVDGVLARAGASPQEVGGWVALRGPGSFTGLRIACATVLGLAQATGARATAVSTLEALALAAPAGAGTVLSLVDALRGEWFVQRWHRDSGTGARPLDDPRRAGPGDPGFFAGVERAVGFGIAAALAGAADPPTGLEAPPIAEVVARAAARGRWPWDAGLLTRPLYLRPPAVTLPR
jgi:tRNA threonylcarbamoyladenosine biosynthesis protein TsaB